MWYDRILLDVDVQRDFFAPGGFFYTHQADKVARQIQRLFAWAKADGIPVISTVLRARPDRLSPFGAPACLEGTSGERRLTRTLLPRRIDFGLRNVTDLPPKVFRQYQQLIFEQRVTDIFTQSRLERLITELGPSTFVLCGAGLAHGVFQAAVGLRSRGLGVILASDAVLALPGEKAEMAILCMEAKGVVFAPTKLIVAPPRCRPTVPFRTAMSTKS
jgi:nicotinamidase-related amidase